MANDLSRMYRTRRIAGFAVVLALVWARPVAAHTDSDFIAVPAGDAATVTFQPTHGCGESPTAQVFVRAPVEGAVAGDVPGWAATASDDGQGGTVLEWTGGSLPSEETGEFPVTFTAPESPGELLTFPAVQVCENDEELAWISGDPEADFPTPRLLILPPGMQAASTLDDIPAGTLGRDQLTEIIDVDNPVQEEPSVTTTDEAASPSAPDTDEPVETTTETQDGSSTNASVIAIVVLVAVAAASVVAGVRRRGRTAPTGSEDSS